MFAVEQDAAALFDEVLRFVFFSPSSVTLHLESLTSKPMVVSRQGLTGIQWLASEAWSTAAVLSSPRKYHQILQGSMGFAIRHADIPGLQDFLLRLHPSSDDSPGDPFLVPFWEEVFQCSLALKTEHQEYRPPCSGAEDLRKVTNIYSDVSQLRISYNVYKAVYAIAHALQNMRRCVPGASPLQSCPDPEDIQPYQVTLKHMLLKIFLWLCAVFSYFSTSCSFFFIFYLNISIVFFHYYTIYL